MTTATKTRRPRKTSAEREQMQREALRRAEQGRFCANDVICIQEFVARGIPADMIAPRVNVFTFNAWKAAGRYVRKGEKGVKLTTWIPATNPDGSPKLKDGKQMTYPVSTTVFHISQTEQNGTTPEPTPAPEPQPETVHQITTEPARIEYHPPQPTAPRGLLF